MYWHTNRKRNHDPNQTCQFWKGIRREAICIDSKWAGLVSILCATLQAHNLFQILKNKLAPSHPAGHPVVLNGSNVDPLEDSAVRWLKFCLLHKCCPSLLLSSDRKHRVTGLRVSSLFGVGFIQPVACALFHGVQSRQGEHTRRK